eukprot:scaffold3290_cov259-Pinguiococcus_pyrenoidosus.AAC.2
MRARAKAAKRCSLETAIRPIYRRLVELALHLGYTAKVWWIRTEVERTGRQRRGKIEQGFRRPIVCRQRLHGRIPFTEGDLRGELQRQAIPTPMIVVLSPEPEQLAEIPQRIGVSRQPPASGVSPAIAAADAACRLLWTCAHPISRIFLHVAVRGSVSAVPLARRGVVVLRVRSSNHGTKQSEVGGILHGLQLVHLVYCGARRRSPGVFLRVHDLHGIEQLGKGPAPSCDDYQSQGGVEAADVLMVDIQDVDDRGQVPEEHGIVPRHEAREPAQIRRHKPPGPIL